MYMRIHIRMCMSASTSIVCIYQDPPSRVTLAHTLSPHCGHTQVVSLAHRSLPAHVAHALLYAEAKWTETVQVHGFARAFGPVRSSTSDGHGSPPLVAVTMSSSWPHAASASSSAMPLDGPSEVRRRHSIPLLERRVGSGR